TVAGCGRNVRFDTGQRLFREGDPADTFYVVRHGSVAVETFVPARGPMMIETIEAGGGGGGGRVLSPDPPAPLAAGGSGCAGAAVRRRLPPREVRPRPGARLCPDDPVRAGADRAPAVDAPPPPRPLWRRRPQLIRWRPGR